MENETGLEKIYELIENFEFDQLTEFEKAVVLKHITKEEYLQQRQTILDTKALFSKLNVEEENRENGSIRILRYPIELYKVAASIIVIAGIGFLLSKNIHVSVPERITMVDTVYINRIDTLFITKSDTIDVIKERIIYKETRQPAADYATPFSSKEQYRPETDCNVDLCPDDISKFQMVKSKGNISHDKALSKFTATIN